jgi:hypothetical protein
MQTGETVRSGVMQLLSTQIDETSVELTYSDNPLVDGAERLVTVRMPIPGPLTHSVMWHQINVLFQLAEWAGAEARRIRNELEKA